MQLDLSGRVALVTGATRLAGIGAAIARSFASAGADIAFTHWTAYDHEAFGTLEDEPRQLADELRSLGARVESIGLDLSDPKAPSSLFDQVEARLGQVSILVNNAAVCVRDDVETLAADNLDQHYAVNVRAMALLSVEHVRRFSGERGGRIINLTSGQSVAPMPDQLSYVMTKGAIEAFTTSSAPSVARKGITVNAIDPGGTDTGWMSEELRSTILAESGFGRIGMPEDAARMALFLASDAGEWITGQVIHSRGA